MRIHVSPAAKFQLPIYTLLSRLGEENLEKNNVGRQEIHISLHLTESEFSDTHMCRSLI